MKCVICKEGLTTSGQVTVTLEKASSTLVFKGVPAQVCENCGEAYVNEEIAAELLQAAQEAIRTGVQVEVREYARPLAS
jgi:YgiT-type zinc finger domain-containing protein